MLALAVGVKRCFLTDQLHNSNMTWVVTLYLNWQEQTFPCIYFFYLVVIYYTTRPAFVPVLIFPYDSNSSELQEVGTHCELSHACELSLAHVLCLPLFSFLSLDWFFSRLTFMWHHLSLAPSHWSIDLLHYVVRLIVKILSSILLNTQNNQFLACIWIIRYNCLN